MAQHVVDHGAGNRREVVFVPFEVARYVERVGLSIQLQTSRLTQELTRLGREGLLEGCCSIRPVQQARTTEGAAHERPVNTVLVEACPQRVMFDVVGGHVVAGDAVLVLEESTDEPPERADIANGVDRILLHHLPDDDRVVGVDPERQLLLPATEPGRVGLGKDAHELAEIVHPTRLEAGVVDQAFGIDIVGEYPFPGGVRIVLGERHTVGGHAKDANGHHDAC